MPLLRFNDKQCEFINILTKVESTIMQSKINNKISFEYMLNEWIHKNIQFPQYITKCGNDLD